MRFIRFIIYLSIICRHTNAFQHSDPSRFMCGLYTVLTVYRFGVMALASNTTAAPGRLAGSPTLAACIRPDHRGDGLTASLAGGNIASRGLSRVRLVQAGNGLTQTFGPKQSNAFHQPPAAAW